MRRLFGSIAPLAALLAGTLVVSTAHAQPGAPPPPPPPGGGGYGGGYGGPPMPPPPPPAGIQRDGFMVGFSLGAGSMFNADCDACESLEGLAFEFRIGGMLNPKLALMYDASGVMHIDGDNEMIITNSSNAIAIQSWVSPRLWLKGGIGLGQYRVSSDFVDFDETGFGFTGAVGYELSQGRSFALDLSFRLSSTRYNPDGGEPVTITNASAAVGFNWY